MMVAVLDKVEKTLQLVSTILLTELGSSSSLSTIEQNLHKGSFGLDSYTFGWCGVDVFPRRVRNRPVRATRHREDVAMRKLLILVLGVFMTTLTPANAGDYFEKGTHSARVEALIDEDYVDGSSVGWEIGYGVHCDENYELALLLMLEDDVSIEQQSLGISIEQNFPFGWQLVPFLGATAGYHWLDTDETEHDPDRFKDKSAFFVRAEAGAKFFLADWVALSASAEYSVSSARVFVDDSDAEDSNIEFGIGARLYF